VWCNGSHTSITRYAARYCQGMVSVCLEHKRKDFWEMELHHAVTCLLVTLSYVCGWNRVSKGARETRARFLLPQSCFS